MKAKMNAGLCVAVVLALMTAVATANVTYDLPATQANYTQLGQPDTVKDGSEVLVLQHLPGHALVKVTRAVLVHIVRIGPLVVSVLNIHGITS